jgi:hypothetical protein
VLADRVSFVVRKCATNINASAYKPIKSERQNRVYKPPVETTTGWLRCPPIEIQKATKTFPPGPQLSCGPFPLTLERSAGHVELVVVDRRGAVLRAVVHVLGIQCAIAAPVQHRGAGRREGEQAKAHERKGSTKRQLLTGPSPRIPLSAPRARRSLPLLLQSCPEPAPSSLPLLPARSFQLPASSRQLDCRTWAEFS